MAIAKAKAVIRVFLMRISKYLPFSPGGQAIPQLHVSRRKEIAPLPVRDNARRD